MTPYQRFFGGGLIGTVTSVVLFLAAYFLASQTAASPVHGSSRIGSVFLAACVTLALTLSIWSFVTLPPPKRGKKLVVTGAFRYVRHPLYTSFFLLIFGLAFWLDDWVFVAWAIAIIPIWQFLVLGEEKLMRQQFPGEYEEYCRKTARFIPGVW